MKVQVEARGAIDIAALTTKALRSCIMKMSKLRCAFGFGSSDV